MGQGIFAAIGVAIAFGVAVIGYFQWRTAHQRIILDLFERRFETYEQIRNAIFEYVPMLQVSNETLRLFIRAQNRAKFLFGDEVLVYLEARYKDLVTVNVFRGLTPIATQEYQDQQRELHEADKRLTAVPNKLEALLIPYMRMNQKMPSLWWPF